MASKPQRDFIAAARQYEADVLSGAVPVCQWIRHAAERNQRDLARQADPEWPYRFDEDKAARVCRFISTLHHIQGPKAKHNEKISLEPWQCWLLTTLFGWVWRDSDTRRFRRAYTEMGRGNGKSLLAAGIALYTGFAEGEAGADVLCTATVLQQARIVLDTARQMCKRNEKLCERFGLSVLAHEIKQAQTTSRLRGMPGKGGTLEGISLHAGIVDELHAQKGREVFDSLSTACAKREQSLLFVITTAGFDASGICAEVHDFTERLLLGDAEDESFFGVIYTIDEGDPWDAEESWRKANPNFGISIDAKAIAEESKRAQQIPSQQASFRTKYLCEWVSSGGETPFLAPEKVHKCYNRALKDDFVGQPAIMGLDLASRLDLCSTVRVHARRIDGRVHYYAFAKNWLPAEAIKAAKNASYPGWLAHGHLVQTDGNVTDLDVIENFVFEEMQKYKVRDINFDPLQSNQLVTHLKKRSGRENAFNENQQFAKYLTQGMRELEEAVASERLHTNSPVLLWALGNLRAKIVGANLLYPVRPKDHALKIDPAVALVMALRSCAVVPLDESAGPANPYLTRGIIYI